MEEKNFKEETVQMINKNPKKREFKRDLDDLMKNNSSSNFKLEKIAKIEPKLKKIIEKIEFNANFLTVKESNHFLEEIYKETNWVQEEIKMMGKIMVN